MTKNDAYKYGKRWMKKQSTYQQLEAKMLEEGYSYADIKMVKDFVGGWLIGWK